MYQENINFTQLQTEMELAKRVQLSLLPKDPPNMAGLDIWAASRSAYLVGGDFYDFIHKAGQPLTFVVGDVSGKGMAAALLMAVTRKVIRSQASFGSMPSPETIISYANTELYDDFTSSNMFATVFVGQYDASRQALVYANAGHSPVIYCPAGGEARLLIADGTALGVMPDSLSKDQTICFQPGDLLVIGTDGLNEARNGEDGMFGYYRLQKLVESLSHLPAQDIVTSLFDAVEAYSVNDSQEDDQALVVLKWTGA